MNKHLSEIIHTIIHSSPSRCFATGIFSVESVENNPFAPLFYFFPPSSLFLRKTWVYHLRDIAERDRSTTSIHLHFPHCRRWYALNRTISDLCPDSSAGDNVRQAKIQIPHVGALAPREDPGPLEIDRLFD